MTTSYYSKDEHRGRYLLPDVRMMMTRNYYSKVDGVVSCGLSDVRTTITKIIIVKLTMRDHADRRMPA